MDISPVIDPPGGAATAAELLGRANALRDARDWIEAAVGYAAYLRVEPADWPIWVQYGHCMKESGDVKAALLLYREGERLQPGDSDLQVQIGHALKLLGRVEEAYQAYAQALTLDPGNADARAELLGTPAGPSPAPVAARPATPAPPSVAAEPVAPEPDQAPVSPQPGAATAAARPAPREPAVAATPMPAVEAAPPAATVAKQEVAGRLAFDASDLLDYFRGNRAPTGIQRVQLNIIGAVLDQVPDAAIVTFDAASGAWKSLPIATFRRLAALSAEGADPADPDWAGAVAAALAALLRSPPIAFPEGARLVNLGTSWWQPDYLRRVREAKARSRDLRYVAMLYDCIPLVTPEHCAAGLVDQFARWFAGLCLHADQVLCISACTEADFRRLAATVLPSGAPPVPSAVVPLDATTPLDGPEAALPPEALPVPLRSGRPYVLCVGTIESRKNHLMLFNAWLALLRRLGAEATPDLVCVGKRGWLAEAALALHANSPTLREKVQLLHGVPDPALAALYRGCLFTLSNSHYEGWGLPVTESLAYGKVPLVPENSSFPESGAGGAVFFTPGSEPDLLEKLERLIRDEGFRAAQAARIAREVRLRSWAELADDLLRHVTEEALPALPEPLRRLPPRLGAAHSLRLLPGPLPSPAMAMADALREGACWSVLEPWGCWTLPGTARLRIPAPEGVEGALRVHLALRAPEAGPLRLGLRVTLPGRPPMPFRPVELAAGESVVCTLDLEVAGEEAGWVELDCAEGVMLGGEGPARDLRIVGAGVSAVMACRQDDLLARLEWLEGVAGPRVVRV